MILAPCGSIDPRPLPLSLPSSQFPYSLFLAGSTFPPKPRTSFADSCTLSRWSWEEEQREDVWKGGEEVPVVKRDSCRSACSLVLFPPLPLFLPPPLAQVRGSLRPLDTCRGPGPSMGASGRRPPAGQELGGDQGGSRALQCPQEISGKRADGRWTDGSHSHFLQVSLCACANFSCPCFFSLRVSSPMYDCRYLYASIYIYIYIYMI